MDNHNVIDVKHDKTREVAMNIAGLGSNKKEGKMKTKEYTARERRLAQQTTLETVVPETTLTTQEDGSPNTVKPDTQ